MIIAGGLAHTQRRETAQGTHTLAMQTEIKFALVVRKSRPLAFRMPQVQHAGREASILAARPGADEPDEQVGILEPPAGERRVEAVHSFEIIAKAGQIAGAGAPPGPPAELAQGTERQPDQGSDAVEISAPALRQKLSKPPALGLEAGREDALAQCGRQQNPVAGDEIPRLGQPAMGGDIIRQRHAVAIEKDAIGSCAGADRSVPDLCKAKSTILVPDVSAEHACATSRSGSSAAVAGREPSSATMISKPASACLDSERRTASSASSRL